MAGSAGESAGDRLARVLADPETLSTVTGHISNGGSLLDLCHTWNVRYSDVSTWLGSDPERRAAYDHAIKAREEWTLQTILQQLRTISTLDARELYNEFGAYKSVQELSAAAAGAVASIKTHEELGDRGQPVTARTVEIKFPDKLKACELLLRDLGRLMEKREAAGNGVTILNVITGVPGAAGATGGGGAGAEGSHPALDAAGTGGGGSFVTGPAPGVGSPATHTQPAAGPRFSP